MTLYGTSGFVLRPVYDQLVADRGEPPLGFPDECNFAWPEDDPAIHRTSHRKRRGNGQFA